MEAGLSWNHRASNRSLSLTDTDMHTLTRESHEVKVGLIVLKMLPIDVTEVDP